MAGKYLLLKEPDAITDELIICDKFSGEVWISVGGTATQVPYDLVWLTKFRPTLEIIEETNIWPSQVVIDNKSKNSDVAKGKF